MIKNFLLNFIKALTSIFVFFFVLVGIPTLVSIYFGWIAGTITAIIIVFSVAAFFIALLAET